MLALASARRLLCSLSPGGVICSTPGLLLGGRRESGARFLLRRSSSRVATIFEHPFDIAHLRATLDALAGS
jgi:hypothetical protein